MKVMKYWNLRTFKELLHQIPKLWRPYPVFKDLPCSGKWIPFQGLSRKCGHPVIHWFMMQWMPHVSMCHYHFY